MSDAWLCEHRVQRARDDHLAAVPPRARPQVHDVVGGADRLLVVLDHEHRVAQVAQLAQRREEPGVVALVQADRRLVEDVEHADEARADLRGEPDALRLAAGERAGRAAERQVLEADVDEEAEPVAHLLEDRARDLGVEPGLPVPADRQALDELERGGDRHLDQVADALPAHQDREALGLEAPAVAGRAGPLDHVRLELLAHRVGGRVLVAALDVAEDPLPPGLVLAAELVALVAELELLPLDPVQQRAPLVGRQVPPRAVEVELQLAAERRQDDLAQVAAGLAPRQDDALEDRDARRPRARAARETSRRVPRPSQSGQAPNGELKENCRGSSSGSERPHTGQA